MSFVKKNKSSFTSKTTINSRLSAYGRILSFSAVKKIIEYHHKNWSLHTAKLICKRKNEKNGGKMLKQVEKIILKLQAK